MRASRLLSILMLLQARGRMSADALAAEVEVSVRTIYRDVDQLSAAGVPVYAERGRAGGFQLLDGWRTKLTGLTGAEAQALFLAGLPGPAAELGLGETMAAAQLKLLAALPAGWQADATRVSARFHLDPAGWYRTTSGTEYIREVAAALWSERRLAIRYESWRGVVDRVVDPLGLVLKGGTWYLVAGVGGAPRTYRVSNILALSQSEERFDRPPGFDLARFWSEAAQAFEAGLQRGEAVLRVSPQGLRLLHGFGAAVADAAARTAGPPDAEGWCRVAIPVETDAHAARELLRLGPEAVVLSPSGLRTAVAEAARRIGALYAASGALDRAG
jgi:predicted DNA-binding transcriptional regulator YafY